MKKLIVSIIILTLTSSNLLAHVEHYKSFNNLNFELFRNGKLIGYHNYKFIRENGTLKVVSDVEFNINKLGVNLYSYKATSEEIYNNDLFYKFSSKTRQNKKDKYVNIILDNDQNNLVIDGSSYKGTANKDFIVGTWWNHEIITAKAQISAISGRIIQQNVTFIGKEQLNINGKNYNALHFNFASADDKLPKEKKLNTDIWYDEETHLWIKASFDKTGYWEYRIKNHN